MQQLTFHPPPRGLVVDLSMSLRSLMLWSSTDKIFAFSSEGTVVSSVAVMLTSTRYNKVTGKFGSIFGTPREDRVKWVGYTLSGIFSLSLFPSNYLFRYMLHIHQMLGVGLLRYHWIQHLLFYLYAGCVRP